MRDFFKQLRQRLGLGGDMREKSGEIVPLEAHDDASEPVSAPSLDALEFITAQDYYRRDGQHPDGTAKWQLRQRIAVHIRDDTWQIREIHTALNAPPAALLDSGEEPDTDKTATHAHGAVALQGEVIANNILDMVGSLDEALEQLGAFEAQLEADDWLPSAAAPEHPTRREVSEMLASASLGEAAE